MNFKTSLLASFVGLVFAAPTLAAPKNIIYMIGDGMERLTLRATVILKMTLQRKWLTQRFLTLFW